MSRRVTWRGVTVDPRTAKMLTEVARLSGSIHVKPTQGSYRGGKTAASAGTHDGCGAVDIIPGTPRDMDALVPIMRKVGFAAWHRTPAQSNWPHHVHAIAVQPGGKNDRGCLSTGAARQVVDYFNGINGLAGRGRDDATRQYVGVTWETYQRDNQPTKEWDEMASEAEIRTIVREEVARFADHEVTVPADGNKKRPVYWLLQATYQMAKESRDVARDIRASIPKG